MGLVLLVLFAVAFAARSPAMACPEDQVFDSVFGRCLPAPGSSGEIKNISAPLAGFGVPGFWYRSLGWNTPMACPPGLIFNGAGCVFPQMPTAPCPEGSVMDASGNCVRRIQGIECPPGMAFSISKRTCVPIGEQTPRCPEGLAYSLSKRTCVSAGDQTPRCPEGFAYSLSKRTCQALPASSPTCPQGFIYSPNRKRCVIDADIPTPQPQPPPPVPVPPISSDTEPEPEPAPQPEPEPDKPFVPFVPPTCPDGFAWNPDINRCEQRETLATCPASFTLHRQLGLCVESVQPPCPAGNYWNGIQCVLMKMPNLYECEGTTVYTGTFCAQTSTPTCQAPMVRKGPFCLSQ